WFTGMLAAVLVIVGFGLFAAGGGVKAGGTKACAPGMSSADCRSAVSLAPPENTIALYLIGAFAGLIAVAVVATMFMCAEYRRGLIRTTLAASPVRGRGLVAKAIVIGAVALVARLAAAPRAGVFASHLAHPPGPPVLSLPVPTHLRPIAGTAA